MRLATRQADFRQLPDRIRVGGKPVRPWVVLVTSRSNDLVLAHEMCAHVCGKPKPGLLDTVFGRRTAGSRSAVIRWAGVSCSPS